MTPDASPSSPSRAPPDGRERCLLAAYDLFCRHGVQAIGVDRIVAEAGVAKMTLYRHFRSKDELVIAALEHRERVWTIGWLIRETERRGRTPEERLLAIFDAFDEWFRREDFEGCLFINTMLESRDPASPIRARAALGLDNVLRFICSLAEEAGMPEAETFARRWHGLLMGAIVLADSGYLDAAVRGREAGLALLEAELGATSGARPRSSG
jgi:AcrR family transcriptional regulator